MLLTILLIVVGAVAYLNVGFFFGHFCWLVNHSGEEKYMKINESSWGRILWPCTRGKDMGRDKIFVTAPVASFQESNYKIAMCVFWWLKALFSILFCAVAFIFFLIVSIIYTLYKILKIIFIFLVKSATIIPRKLSGVNGISKISLKEEFKKYPEGLKEIWC
jgi:hypothetical protein